MTTLTTQLGSITGKSENDIQMFLGIPYAKTPVGERRFKVIDLVTLPEQLEMGKD